VDDGGRQVVQRLSGQEVVSRVTRPPAKRYGVPSSRRVNVTGAQVGRGASWATKRSPLGVDRVEFVLLHRLLCEGDPAARRLAGLVLLRRLPCEGAPVAVAW
jgi:hypothetical protein